MGRTTETFGWRDTAGQKDRGKKSERVNKAGCWENGRVGSNNRFS